MKAGRYKVLSALAALALPLVAWAQPASEVEPSEPVAWQLNMTPGVTQTSQMAEVIWTIVPVIILIVMAWPATAKLIAQYDTRDSAMTVKVTGYQWMWKYEYLGEDYAFTSRLDRKSDEIRQSGRQPTYEEHPHYLRDVDNPLVLPVGTKIRFVITSDDVIHAWWVPALGWKQDAIPGIVNEAWTEISRPGVYRGQCAELCGKDHGFMQIVVKAVPRAEFRDWLSAQKAATNAPQAAE